MIVIDSRSQAPIYEQITRQIKELIAKGGLVQGEKLPSVRDMSSMILVNPNTVSRAYQELEREGIIETLRGKGTFVSTQWKPRLEEERLASMREMLHNIVVEATHLGVTGEEMKKWIDEEMEELRGDRDAGSEES